MKTSPKHFDKFTLGDISAVLLLFVLVVTFVGEENLHNVYLAGLILFLFIVTIWAWQE